jgi:hypothetical protein
LTSTVRVPGLATRGSGGGGVLVGSAARLVKLPVARAKATQAKDVRRKNGFMAGFDRMITFERRVE